MHLRMRWGLSTSRGLPRDGCAGGSFVPSLHEPFLPHGAGFLGGRGMEHPKGDEGDGCVRLGSGSSHPRLCASEVCGGTGVKAVPNSLTRSHGWGAGEETGDADCVAGEGENSRGSWAASPRPRDAPVSIPKVAVSGIQVTHK